MTYSIAVISARESVDNIRASDFEIRKECKITYFTYNSLSELREIYEANHWKYDGILFSGSFPRDYILDNIGPIRRPYRCLELKEQDYYLLFARLLAQNPGLKLSKVYIDTIINPAIVQNILGEQYDREKIPYFISSQDKNSLPYTSYDAHLRLYKKLWEQKKFHVFVTRFTNLANQLKEENIPHVLLRPSFETITDSFHDLLNDISQSAAEHELVAYCVIELPKSEQTKANYQAVEKVLTDFNTSQIQGAIIRKNDNHFEFITSGQQVKKITNDYTICLLSHQLRSEIPFPVYVGWGIGFEVMSAYKNAIQATSACRRKRDHLTYLITEKQEVVGPLSGNRSLRYDLHPDARIYSVAKTLGISAKNLEKLIFLQKNRQENEFTSSDLVYYLEITPRSASRILSRLKSYGLAAPVRNTNLNGHGRPTTIYRLSVSSIVPEQTSNDP